MYPYCQDCGSDSESLSVEGYCEVCARYVDNGGSYDRPVPPCDGCGNSAPDSLEQASVGDEMLCPDCKAQEGTD